MLYTTDRTGKTSVLEGTGKETGQSKSSNVQETSFKNPGGIIYTTKNGTAVGRRPCGAEKLIDIRSKNKNI